MKEWKDVTDLVNHEEWAQARYEINRLKEVMPLDDTSAILEASVCEHENNPNGVYESLRRGLEYNYRNYELYVMLGNYYLQNNVNQAYLCYENAELYCENDYDKEYIIQCKNEIKKHEDFCIQPVSIVIVSYNNKEMMKNCIQSIRDNNLKSSYELVIVDNASNDGIEEWLSEQEDVILINNSENKGFGYASNQGVKAAKANHDIFFLNNDVIVPPNAIFWLRMGLYENERIGATGSESNYVANGQCIEQHFDTVEQYIEYGKKHNIPCRNPYEKKFWLSGFALMIKRQALDMVGLFDHRFGKGYYEDDDLGVRLRYAGYELLLCRNSFIFHYGSKSFKNSGNEFIQLSSSNRLVFKEKWGYDIEQYSYARYDLLNLIEEDNEKPIKVLEIGCGAGTNLSRIQYLYPNSEVKGIEENEKVARLGKYYFDIISEKPEVMDVPYEKNYFNYIIFNDVLETFYFPEKVIEKFKPYLMENGHMIVSFFNIMHASVINSLLNGEFIYREEGILSEKHIRFFTLNSVCHLFNKCNLTIEGIQGIVDTSELSETDKSMMKAIYQIVGNDTKNLIEMKKIIVKTTKGGELK